MKNARFSETLRPRFAKMPRILRPSTLVLSLSLTASVVSAQSLYWDLNGSQAGSGSDPSGWWVNTGISYFETWNTKADGKGNTTRWTNGADAIFSAGNDAAHSDYTINIWNTVRPGSITVEDGNVTFASGTILFDDASPDFTVNHGSTAIIDGANIAGTQGLTKRGEGTLVFQGNSNAYTGTTRIENGTLRLGSSNQLSDSSRVDIGRKGTLDIGNQSEVIDSLTGSGTVNIGSGGSLTVGANNGNSIFDGIFAGDGNFIKTGNGTFTFNNDVLFGGTVFLNGGTLGLGGFDVELGSLYVGADSVIDFGELTSSTLTLGSLEIAEGVTLRIENWSDAEDLFITQEWINAVYDESGDVPMSQIIFNGWDGDDTIWYGDNNEIAPVVPESSTYGATMMGMLSIGWIFRRRPRTRSRA